MDLTERATAAFVPRSLKSRLLFPVAVTILGCAITLVAWWAWIADKQVRQRDGFRAVVEQSHEILSQRIAAKITALRRIVGYWRLYGLEGEEEWQYEARSVMAYFPGIVWIAWVPANGMDGRVAAADSLLRPTPAQLAEAREHIGRPESEIAQPQHENDPLMFFAVGRPEGDSIGVFCAAILPERMFEHRMLGTTDLLALTVLGPGGRAIFHLGTPAAQTAASMRIEKPMVEALAGEWRIRYQPTEAYLSSSNPAWPSYFLLTGLLLSLTLGLVAHQFVRIRDTSGALVNSNRRLDRQVRELSERDRELRELNQSLEAKVLGHTAELREALHELEAFSHSISHDLRSPIGAMMNFAAVLVEDYGGRLDENGIQLLRRILSSGETATRLLDQLVDFAGVSRATEPRVRVDMTALARDAYQEAVAAERAGGAPIELHLEPLPEARGEPDLIARVFRNLIRNAVKYARPREVRRIEIGAAAGEAENTYFVADNGIGFDPQLREKIFEPFRRSSQAREFEGSGLGLAIVEKIIRKHGGRAWAESDGATGARFFFTLPKEEAGT